MANLLMLPDFFKDSGGWIINGTTCLYPVTFEGKTCIKMGPNQVFINYMKEKGYGAGLYELNGGTQKFGSIKALPFTPGDHLIYKASIKSDPSTTGAIYGCAIGMDAFNQNSGRICELRNNDTNGTGDAPWNRAWAVYGSQWQDVTFDVVAQAAYTHENTHVSTPCSFFVVWVQSLAIMSKNAYDPSPNWESEKANFYLADMQLLRNEQPEPTPVDCYSAAECENKYGSAGANNHWECRNNQCVKVADPTPTPSPSIAARTVGPFGIPSALLRELWVLREKHIRKEVHRKLHPLV